MALAFAAGGCGDEPPPAPEVVRPVKVLTIGEDTGGERVEFPGVIAPVQLAEMAFEVPGRILELPVNEGQAVEAGTLLARLDPRDYSDELAKQRAQVDKAKADYDRYQKLFDAGVAPEADLEGRKRNYEVTLASLRQARKAVEDAALRAPFDGVVARKLVEDFANVQAKQPVVAVHDVSRLQIDVAVPESVLVRGEKGSTNEEITRRIRPEVVVAGIPGRTFPAELSERAGAADPNTRTFAATFTFDNPPDVNLMPGMTARVVATPSSPAGRGVAAAGGIRIPANAVVADESGGAFVWKFDPGASTVSRSAVTLGTATGADVHIRTGLSHGDQIAVSGVHLLRDGLTVRRLD